MSPWDRADLRPREDFLSAPFNDAIAKSAGAPPTPAPAKLIDVADARGAYWAAVADVLRRQSPEAVSDAAARAVLALATLRSMGAEP